MLKSHWIHLVLGVFLLLAPCSIAEAYMTLDQYQESKKKDNINSTESTNHYIMGVANGFIVSNITLKDRGDEPFYCQPDTLTIPLSFYIQLIDKMLEEKTLDSKTGVEFIMLYMLKKAFPCGENQ